MPTIKELMEFVSKIPETPAGKLEAMNKVFMKEENMEEAFKTMLKFQEDLFRSKPEYFETLKNCKTEEEIKQKSGEFFANHPEMIEEVMLSMVAARRDRLIEDENKN
ncbi:TPA: hypothetical protein HA246_06740 [Candidatus Woesearchaeota archaeon]|nr:hypothetical protein [Candidatus Woesearchaeota archaeon]